MAPDLLGSWGERPLGASTKLTQPWSWGVSTQERVHPLPTVPLATTPGCVRGAEGGGG